MTKLFQSCGLWSVVCGLVAANAAAIGAHRWDVETSRVQAHNIELIRGESLDLEPRFLVARQPVDLSSAVTVTLRYRTSDMTTNYYAVTGAVLVATSGTCRVTWTSAAEVSTNTTFAYTIVVDAADGPIRRAFGTLTIEDSVGTASTNSPLTRQTADWGVLLHDNLVSAPFPLDAEHSSLSGRVTTVEGTLGTATGDIAQATADLNTVSGRVTTVEGTLGTATGDIAQVTADLNTVSGRVTTVEAGTGTWNTAYNTATGNVAKIAAVSNRVTLLEGYVWPQTSTNDTPTAYTPRALGDRLLIHTSTNVLYYSFGLTTNDWEKLWP